MIPWCNMFHIGFHCVHHIAPKGKRNYFQLTSNTKIGGKNSKITQPTRTNAHSISTKGKHIIFKGFFSSYKIAWAQRNAIAEHTQTHNASKKSIKYMFSSVALAWLKYTNHKYTIFTWFFVPSWTIAFRKFSFVSTLPIIYLIWRAFRHRRHRNNTNRLVAVQQMPSKFDIVHQMTRKNNSSTRTDCSGCFWIIRGCPGVVSLHTYEHKWNVSTSCVSRTESRNW